MSGTSLPPAREPRYRPACVPSRRVVQRVARLRASGATPRARRRAATRRDGPDGPRGFVAPRLLGVTQPHSSLRTPEAIRRRRGHALVGERFPGLRDISRRASSDRPVAGEHRRGAPRLSLGAATSGAMLLMRAIRGAHPSGVLRTSYFAVLRNGGDFWRNKSHPAGRANKQLFAAGTAAPAGDVVSAAVSRRWAQF